MKTYPYEGGMYRLCEIRATVPCLPKSTVSRRLAAGITTKAGMLAHDVSAAKAIGGRAAKAAMIVSGKLTYRNQRV